MTPEETQVVSDPAHTTLLFWLLGGITTLVVGFFSVFITLAKLRKVLQEEVHNGLVISLNNHGGELVKNIAYTAVVRALHEHQLDCPLKERVATLEDERG